MQANALGGRMRNLAIVSGVGGRGGGRAGRGRSWRRLATSAQEDADAHGRPPDRRRLEWSRPRPAPPWRSSSPTAPTSRRCRPPRPGPKASTFVSTQVGTWEPVGPRSVHFTGVQLLSDANGAFVGTVTIDAYPMVSEDGQTCSTTTRARGRPSATRRAPSSRRHHRRPARDGGPDGRGRARLPGGHARGRHADLVTTSTTDRNDGPGTIPGPSRYPRKARTIVIPRFLRRWRAGAAIARSRTVACAVSEESCPVAHKLCRWCGGPVLEATAPLAWTPRRTGDALV